MCNRKNQINGVTLQQINAIRQKIEWRLFLGNFGPNWLEVAGFGEAPQQAIFDKIPVREIIKNTQVCIHSPCLQVSGKAKNNIFGGSFE